MTSKKEELVLEHFGEGEIGRLSLTGGERCLSFKKEKDILETSLIPRARVLEASCDLN